MAKGEEGIYLKRETIINFEIETLERIRDDRDQYSFI